MWADLNIENNGYLAYLFFGLVLGMIGGNLLDDVLLFLGHLLIELCDLSGQEIWIDSVNNRIIRMITEFIINIV